MIDFEDICTRYFKSICFVGAVFLIGVAWV